MRRRRRRRGGGGEEKEEVYSKYSQWRKDYSRLNLKLMLLSANT
jgi:hypothetical protein